MLVLVYESRDVHHTYRNWRKYLERVRLEGGGDGGGAGERPEERIKKNGAPRAHPAQTTQSQGERETPRDRDESGERETGRQERDHPQGRA